jgi:hypothetical protein
MTKWKLVPVEPTPEMLDAVSWPSIANFTYSAMLEAAPNPPVLSDERILEIWASNSGRAVTTGKVRIIAQARAIEREILGGDE